MTSSRWLKAVGTQTLALLLSFHVLSGARLFMPVSASNAQAETTLTFTSDRDAYVRQASPNSNYGNASSLQVDGASDPDTESFIHFTVTGISGTVQNAQLRVYATTNGTRNGPALYTTDTAWLENEITWKNRPARTSDVLDNKTNIRTSSWVEYDVTSQVTADGTFSFVLAADSADAVRFSSRQGTRAPQLIVNVSRPEDTPEPTGTATPEPVDTPTPEATDTSDPSATDTAAPEWTPTDVSDPTSTSEPADTATPTPEPDTATPTDTESPTSPPTATAPGSVVFVGAGDISLCSNNNDEATAKLLDNIPGTVFTTGDNAYTDGSYTQYINCYDPTWGRHKARTKPVPGNHEYLTSGAAGYFQYFSNAPAYSAYNLGAWRIYALNSEISVSATSPQITWLRDDLAAHPSQCVQAYWHKPRWSSGSNHGNNSSMQTLWQIFYDAGAELVINGHEHNYERFAEMNASGAAISQGLREFVVGTGGANLYPFGTVLSTSQARNNTAYGVLKLTLHPGSYEWEFLPVAGATFTDSGSDTCH